MRRLPVGLGAAVLVYVALRALILVFAFDQVALVNYELYPMGTLPKALEVARDFPLRLYYDNAAGQLDREAVGEDTDDGQEGHAGVKEPFVLLAAIADESVLVSTSCRQCPYPGGWEQQEDPRVGPRGEGRDRDQGRDQSRKPVRRHHARRVGA